MYSLKVNCLHLWRQKYNYHGHPVLHLQWTCIVYPHLLKYSPRCVNWELSHLLWNGSNASTTTGDRLPSHRMNSLPHAENVEASSNSRRHQHWTSMELSLVLWLDNQFCEQMHACHEESLGASEHKTAGNSAPGLPREGHHGGQRRDEEKAECYHEANPSQIQARLFPQQSELLGRTSPSTSQLQLIMRQSGLGSKK